MSQYQIIPLLVDITNAVRYAICCITAAIRTVPFDEGPPSVCRCHVPRLEYHIRIVTYKHQHRVHIPRLVLMYSLKSCLPESAIITSPKTGVCTAVCLIELPTTALACYIGCRPRLILIEFCTSNTVFTDSATVPDLILHNYTPGIVEGIIR